MKFSWHKLFLLGSWVVSSAIVMVGQEKCLEPGRLEAIKKQISAETTQHENASLKAELVKLSQDLLAANAKARVDEPESEKAKRALAEIERSAAARVCSILNTTGWPKTASISSEGTNGFLYLITRSLSLQLQLELYPLVSEAYVKGELQGGEVLASYVDRLRLAIGRRQLYGSQVTIKDGFLVMSPIERASEVDKRRAEFKMQPLRAYERRLETLYKLPLIRGVMEPVRTAEQQKLQTAKASDANAFEADTGDAPVINVETAFVSIDVNIPDRADATSAKLEKSDFNLFDNGKLIEIETFAKAETPFDIVLLLDLSGSTSEKVGLIKKTTRRFVELKRPGDRLAVIVFNHEQTVISEFEADQAVLLERIKKIGGSGGSHIWDAVRSGIEMLEQKSEKGCRKAIVLMSDGVDNLLGFYGTVSARMGFADLVEQIQNSNVTIFPIYLDTQGSDSHRVHETARRTLSYMADQSGGTVYTAKKLDDLNGIYDRVLKGVGTVYTLGFTPDVDATNRSWRTIKVETPANPGLKLRHRPGYFTR